MEMQQPQQGRQLETSGVNLAAAVFLIGIRDEIKKSERPHWTLRLVGVSLKDLWKSSNINGLQAASKAIIPKIKEVLSNKSHPNTLG